MAKSVKALITPEVLKWARERRINLGVDYAARRLEITPERLEALENGTDQPTFALLKKISKLYRTHISIFYLPEPPPDFQPLTDYRVLPKQDPEIEEQQLYRLNVNIIEAYERRETLIELYELLEEAPPEITLNIDSGENKNENRKQAARKITEFLELKREQLQQANDRYTALKFWKQTIEAKGILVCQTNPHLSIDLKTIRGFCIAQRPFPMIVLNSKDSPYGRIFTLIHELVHIALGESVIQNTNFEEVNTRKLNSIEAFCNHVAGEILVPKNELLEIVNLETLEKDLPKISKHFHVSPEVIMRRLQILKKIPLSKYKAYRNSQLKKYENTSKRDSGRPPYSNRLLNASGEHFARTAFTAYYEDKITISELVSAFSNCDTKHLSKIESRIST